MWEGKVIAITGSGSGMGRELALLLASNGALLSLADINEKFLNETKKIIDEKYSDRIPKGYKGDKVFVKVVDVSKEKDIEEYAHATGMHFNGAVDMIINSAGVAATHNFENLEIDKFRKVMDINFYGTFYTCKYFMPLLRKDVNKRTYIVNISSMEGLLAVPGNCAYVSAKFAVRGLSESMIVEGPWVYPNIQVSCVHPGVISTPIILNSRSLMDNPKIGSPDMISVEEIQKYFNMASPTTPKQAAEIILSGVERGKTRIVVGIDAVILDFLIRLFPRLVYHKYLFLFFSTIATMTGKILSLKATYILAYIYFAYKVYKNLY